MGEQLRRVVTDHDDNGTSVIRSDKLLKLSPLPGVDAHGAVVWTTGSVPADNETDDLGAERDMGATIRGGSVFRITEFGPGFVSPMHRTHSIDYCYVIAGELELELDDGATVRLSSGDIVVQRGTHHIWRNPSADTPIRLLVCMIEAEPVRVSGVALEQHF